MKLIKKESWRCGKDVNIQNNMYRITVDMTIKEYYEIFKKLLKQGGSMKKFKLEITPAIEPEERHKIEKVLTEMGYNVWAGGTDNDMSSCDIAFDSESEDEINTR